MGRLIRSARRRRCGCAPCTVSGAVVSTVYRRIVISNWSRREVVTLVRAARASMLDASGQVRQ